MAEKTAVRPGLVAAIRQIMDENLTEQVEEQLALLPSPGSAPMEPGEAVEPGGKRGPGRPPGAKNKSTQDWVSYLQKRYRDPREFLAEAYNRPVQVLAAELNCDLLEAFKVQLISAKEMLPYVAQKQTTASDDGGKPPVPLAIYVSEQGASLVEAGARGDGNRMIVAEILPPIDKGKSDDNSDT